MAESQTDLTQPANARALLQKFEATFPDSPLRPQVELAIARTYEREQDWPAAIDELHPLAGTVSRRTICGPQTVYSLAQANFQAGNETNAFVQFTNFVAQFPTNDLAPLAQWWVADHFFRSGRFRERGKKLQAHFSKHQLAGFAAGQPDQSVLSGADDGRTGRRGAAGLYRCNRDYFTKLEADTNCPLDLRVQATFAHGDALMRSDSTDTNNPLANFGLATNEFFQIVQLYPTNELGLLALFYIAECNFQLTNYDAATNAYAQIFNSPFAGLYARSQAQIGFGIALENKAALATGAGQNALLNAALDNYLAVFNGLNLRDDEQPDSFWLRNAGLQAAPLVGLLNNPDAETKILRQFEKMPAATGEHH